MKRTLFFLAMMIIVLLISCASQPAPVEPEPVATAPVKEEVKKEEPVKYNKELILDGAQKHTVVKGETLTKIAEAKYNEKMYYPVIILASKAVVNDPDKIYPGTVLTIPNLDRNLKDAGAKDAIKDIILNYANNIEAKRNPDVMSKAMKEFVNKL